MHHQILHNEEDIVNSLMTAIRTKVMRDLIMDLSAGLMLTTGLVQSLGRVVCMTYH